MIVEELSCPSWSVMAGGQFSEFTYDVFLSFRGDDTRYGFTKYLYDALTKNNIRAFMDAENLGKGEEIEDVLVKAIEESKIAIIVFSESYASSTWCLDELLKILDCKNRRGQQVIPVFYKVEPTAVRKQRGSYGEAMRNHEDRFEDDIEKVHRWRSGLFKAASISGWDTKNKFEGDLIKDIVKDVSEKLKTLLSNGSHKFQVQARPSELNKDFGKEKRVSPVKDGVYRNCTDMATATSEIMKPENIGRAKAKNDDGKVGNYGGKPMTSEVEHSVNRSYVGSSGAVESKVGNHVRAEATVDGDDRLWTFGDSRKFLELNTGLRFMLKVIPETGTFGMGHIVGVGNDEKVIAVKRLKKMQISNKDFKSVVEPIGAMDHENLLKLRAYYCSKEEKLLFYNFERNRSLYIHLHGIQMGDETRKRRMDWEMRLDIALQTARGIRHLHQFHNLPHGNLKSSNVILTDLYEARLSEYCLTPLDDPSSPVKDDGYCAPEVTGPRTVTLVSDVYSFGVVLMELVSEKNPTSFKKNEGGLPRWVKSMAESNSIDQVIPSGQFHRRNSREMGKLLEVAIACTASNPAQRPPMAAVTQSIEELKQSSIKPYPPTLTCKKAEGSSLQYRRMAYDVNGYETVNEWSDVKYQWDLGSISLFSQFGDIMMSKTYKERK